MNENIKDMIEELTKEQKQAKLAEWSCKMDVLTVMLNAIEDDLDLTLASQKTVKYWHGYLNGIHSQTVNQDLSNNDINSIGLVSVKGC